VSGSNLYRSEACCAPGTTVVPLTSLSDSQTGSHSGDPSGLPPSSSRFFCSSSASLVSVNLKDLQSRRTERQIADSARVVTVPKAEPMARRLSCSACPATAVQGFPARPAPAPDSAGCSDRLRAVVWLWRGGCRELRRRKPGALRHPRSPSGSRLPEELRGGDLVARVA